ncbi:MAG: SDR family NAD(P)-dependent oxidoreductase [Anaerolineae bacterium]|nr:SDR family NAD(P)-dependent oxidoreductase [Anaerolineae bacterium]
MLLITGANGQLGRLIVEEVLRRAPGQPLAVSVREPDRATDLAARGVEVRRGDYDEPPSLTGAFHGVNRLLLMPTPEPDPVIRVNRLRAAIEAAVAVGVSHIVYPSAHAIDRFDNPLFATHLQTEKLIQESGTDWTMLRNAIYADVIAREVQGAITAGELAAPAGTAAIAPVLRRDLAAATAVVLMGEGHEGRIYELTGPDTLDWHDLAALASEKADRPIAYRAIDDDEAADRLKAAGLPEPVVGALLGFYAAYRAGWCGTPSPDLANLAGRATPSLDAVRVVIEGTAR